MPQSLVAQAAWAMVRRLVEREWFTARSSACGLVASIYARLPVKGGRSDDNSDRKDEDMTDSEGSGGGAAAATLLKGASKDDCFALFQQLSSADQVPMVRRAAASNLAGVGSALAGGTIGLTSVSFTSSSSSSSSEGKEAERGSSSSSSSSSRQVELGDVGTSSVPPSVPRPVSVSCSSQEAGARAANFLLPILQGFAHDDQDGVRLLAVDGCVALARLINGGMVSLGNVDNASDAATKALSSQTLSKYANERAKVLEVVAALSKDHSWRVRWSIANRLSELADSFGRQLTSERLLPRFQDLLLDTEAEVKTCAAFRVHDIGKVVGRQALLDAIMPCVLRLSEDPSEHVRAALSTVILDLAPVLGKDSTIDVLLPQFLKYLKDPSSQVRLNVISNLEAVNKVVLLKTLSQSLLPAIRELSTDKTWRVRQAIISFTPQLARQLGTDVFDEHPELADLCLKWLNDPVFAVREAAAENMKRLCEIFGPAWADRILVSKLLTVYGSVVEGVVASSKTGGSSAGGNTSSFQQRMTVLTAMGRLGEAVGPAVLSSRLLPAITALARDSVPNVRFTVARALHKLVSGAKAVDQASVKSLVRPCLTTLSGDSDADVRYYAQKAINSM